MLLTPRLFYAPFEYNQAYEYWEQQQQAHWLHSEISMSQDVNDWRFNLTPEEKSVVGHVLKGFTTAELHIEEYWSSKVSSWFKIPEIQLMSSAFAAMESIHAVAYAYLNQTLGLEDYEIFSQDPTTKAKMDRLSDAQGDNPSDIVRSLAIFSAFNEGVNLFSSFAILLNFSRFNKLKGVGQIIAFSAKDETLHSNAGIYLARTMVSEYPELWTDELKKDLYDAARLTIKLEDDYIDKAFEKGDIEGLSAPDLKAYIRFRCNTKLQDIGLKTNWKNVDMAAVRRITEWFEPAIAGIEMQDFFAGRVSSYSKSVISFTNIWD